MKLKQVLDTADKANVLEIILKSYSSVFNLSFKTGEDQDVFSRAYDTLKSTSPKDFSDTMLVIEKEEEEGDSSYVVYGLEPDAEGKMRHWGLSYIDWSEWLAMEISQETLSMFSADEIIAHCLWEMMMFPASFLGKTSDQTVPL